MARKKVYLPTWIAPNGQDLNKDEIVSVYPDISKGEVIINIASGRTKFITFDENDKPIGFDSSEIVDEKISASVKLVTSGTVDQINIISGAVNDVYVKIDETFVSAVTSAITWTENQYYTNSGYVENIKIELSGVSSNILEESKIYADGSAASAFTSAKTYTDSLASNYDAAGAAASAETNAKAYADSLADNYDEAGAAASAETNAKAYADSLADNYDEAGAAASAFTSAKTYTDSLADNYDEAGAAASAFTSAKTYTDSLADNYDVAGAAASAFTSAKTYSDGLAEEINERIDNLIVEGGGGETNVINSISVNGSHITPDGNKNVNITVPSIDGLASEEYVIEVYASAKTYTDSLARNYDAAGAAASAFTSAKTYTDSLASNYDAAGAAASAETNAKAYADSLADNYDEAGAAASAFTSAKTYTDGLAEEINERIDNLIVESGGGEINVINSISVNGSHITPDGNKNVNITVPSIDGLASEEYVIEVYASAKTYTDSLADNYDVAGAAASAFTSAKTYSDGLAEEINERIDNLSVEGGSGETNVINSISVNGSHIAPDGNKNVNITVPSIDGLASEEYVIEVYASARTYSDSLADNYDVAGAAASAFTSAKTYSDSLAGNYDVAGAAASAFTSAKTYTDSLSVNYALKTVVDTLVGSDENISVRTIAAEEVAKIVNSADSSYDTLKKIADWILNDTTGAAGMANDIDALQAISADTRLVTLETSAHYHTNKTIIDGITSDDIENWNSAETNAKEYAEEQATQVIDWVDEQNFASISDVSESGDTIYASAITWVENQEYLTDITVTTEATKLYLVGSENQTGTTNLKTSSTEVYMENGNLFAASDETLKDFGENVSIDLEAIKKIPKVYYTWKNDVNKKMQIGTSAQKLMEIYPELVSGANDGKLAVSYEKLSIIALAAIDKLNEENEHLKQRLKLIEEKLGL